MKKFSSGNPSVLVVLASIVAAVVIVYVVSQTYWRSTGQSVPSSAEPAAVAGTEPPTDEPTRKIKARLFFVGADGESLRGVEQEVNYADDQAEQAREIMRAQLAARGGSLVSAIPPGTTLRALFLTQRGEAYVDLSSEVATAHRGGTTYELLTVYTIVHALTANLPAVTSVQLLIDGKEVETLAGHVNLERPFRPNPDWVQE